MTHSDNPSNVIALVHSKIPKTEAQENAEWYNAQISAFNALYGKYLRARGKSVTGGSDKTIDRALDELEHLTWELIRTRAFQGYHVEYKFEVMRELMEGGWVDGRHHAMLESIRLDHKELMIHQPDK